MKKEHLEYLVEIGIKKIIKERIEEIYQFYLELCPEEIDDLFVTDYIKEDDSRVYEKLTFYSKNYVLTAHDFQYNDAFSVINRNTRKPYGFTIKKKDYDFKKATTKSRMTITIGYINKYVTILKASKENCDYLKRIFEKKYKPLVIDA